MSNKQARIKSMKNTTFESAMNSSSFASTESAAKKNESLMIVAVIGIALDGRKRIAAIVDNEEALLIAVTDARESGEYSIVTYCNADEFARIYVKSEELDDFQFFYGVAENWGLEREYLQSILDGLTPIGAAIEWDL